MSSKQILKPEESTLENFSGAQKVFRKNPTKIPEVRKNFKKCLSSKKNRKNFLKKGLKLKKKT